MEFKKADNTIRYFDELFIGNLFMEEGYENEIYLRIDQPKIDDRYNAVKLNTGTLHIFLPKTKIVKVDGTLSYHEMDS